MGKIYIVPLLSLFLFACDGSKQTEPVVSSVALQDDSATLASVNNSAITEYQLDSAINRTLGDSAALYGDQKFQQKMLQSLIVSRSMSLLAEKQLDEQALMSLDEKVRSYREELLVKNYLQSNTQVEPVSVEQIKAYYDKYPAQFGAETVKEFELIASTGKLSSADKVQLLKKLESANSKKDWQAWSNSLSTESSLVSYKKAKTKLSILSAPIQKLLKDTAVGETSEVHYGEQLLIARVISEEQLPAKPLSQVSIEIRKKLAPVNMKKAVKQASELAKKQVNIEIK
ncbi:MAG: hypothetical protein GY951_12710 [Psychromonas sp.]|nr:hypothetical protein [Alteromonadales bacterium]MCP5078902.1 hypothetical protein [Psychromonas sp.]